MQRQRWFKHRRLLVHDLAIAITNLIAYDSHYSLGIHDLLVADTQQVP